ASDTDGGWAGIMTISSSQQNTSASGQDRVNIQTADQNSLTSVKGISQSMARAIVSYRGQNSFQSIADLLDVTAPHNQNQSGNSSGNQNNSNQSQSDSQNTTDSSTSTSNSGTTSSGSSGSGQKVISQDTLIDIADDITTTDANQDLTGAININTA